MDLMKLVGWFFPPEAATEAQMKTWYRNVALTLMLGAILCGWALSPWGFAYAGDVKEQINKALEPIVTAQNTQATAQIEQAKLLNKVSDQLNSQLANAAASEIRYLVAKRCQSGLSEQEKERVRKEIDTKQEEYSGYKKGEKYNYGCADL